MRPPRPRALCLGLMLGALLALTATATAAGASKQGLQLHLTAGNGYQIVVAGHGATAFLTVSRPHRAFGPRQSFSTYIARARVGASRIEAGFGDLGRVAMRFDPSGRVVRGRSGPDCTGRGTADDEVRRLRRRAPLPGRRRLHLGARPPRQGQGGRAALAGMRKRRGGRGGLGNRRRHGGQEGQDHLDERRLESRARRDLLLGAGRPRRQGPFRRRNRAERGAAGHLPRRLHPRFAADLRLRRRPQLRQRLPARPVQRHRPAAAQPRRGAGIGPARWRSRSRGCRTSR